MALDGDPEGLQPLDQQLLMLVLREDIQEGIRRQVRADTLEGQARRGFALDPQIDRWNLVAEFEHGIGQIKL
ncbi:MAG TPA: hypothetical protein VGF39_17905, partial [Stellaceae bacterium]